MAYDGEIKIGVQLDTSKTKGSAAQLGRNIEKAMSSGDARIRNMGLSMQKLADKMERARAKMAEMESTQLPTEQFAALSSAIDATTAKIDKAKSALLSMQESGKATVPTDEYAELMSQRDWVQKRVGSLLEKKSLKGDQKAELSELQTQLVEIDKEMQALVTSGQAFKASDAYRTKAEEVKQLESELSKLQSQQQAMVDSGTAYTSGADTAAYATEAQNMGYMEQQADIMNQKFDEATSSGSRLKAIFSQLGSAVGGAFKKIGSFIKNQVTKGANDAHRSFGRLFRQVLKYGLGVRSLFILYRKLRQYTIQAFKDMAKQYPEINAQLSGLLSNFSQFKASLATAFQPLLNIVLPILNTIINALTTAANAVGAFFASLTGQGFIYKAVKQQKNFAGAVGGTGKAAKQAKEELADYDKLVVISSNDAGAGGGGGGGGAGSGAATFEKTPIDGFLGDFGKLLAEKIKEGDWKGVGQAISDKLSEVMESIPWNKVYEKARNFGTGLAQFLNGLINPRLFGNLGKTLAGALNTAFEFLYSFATTFDWVNLGKSIAAGINNFFKTFDFKKAGATFSKLAIGLLNTISTAIQDVDWDVVGQKIVEFLGSIDWVELFGSAQALSFALIGALLELFFGIVAQLSQQLGELFKELGLDAISGFFKGVAENIRTSISWIKKQFNKIVKAIKDFFQIHSPSKLMEGIGKDVIQGFWNGILKLIQKLEKKISKWLEPFTESFDEVVEYVGGLWDKFTSSIKDISAKFKLNVGGALSRITDLDTWRTKFTALANVWKDKVSTLKANVGGAISKITDLDTWKTKFTSLFNVWKDKAATMKATVSGALSKITDLDTWKSKMDSLRSAWANKTADLKATLSGISNINVLDTWKSKMTSLKNSWVGKTATFVLNQTGTAIQALLDKIKTLRDSWKDKVATFSLKFSAAASDLKQWVNTNVIDKINSKFRSVPILKHHLIPHLASGAVIPPNKEFLAVLGDQKKGTNIEAPLDTIVQAFRTALREGAGNSNPIILQLSGRTVAEVVWDETEKRYKQKGISGSFAY